MIPDNTSEALCRMALQFKMRGNISMIALLTESGYLENYPQITEEHLTEYFRKHKELIEPWLIVSVDNRSGKGWYIEEQEGGFIRGKSWIVGYYPGDDKRKFKNEAEACGFFVKKWAEDIRQVIEKNS
jgi:hypothetical protein